jgi:CheY-like chemotaxis protein
LQQLDLAHTAHLVHARQADRQALGVAPAGAANSDALMLVRLAAKQPLDVLVLPIEAAPNAAMVAQLQDTEHQVSPTQVGVKLAGRILLAEDGPDNQQLIAFHLRKAGATVEIADNGRIALEMIEKAASSKLPYDMLLTDMQMPEMDGYTLASTLRERGSTLPIVALTANAMAEDRFRCIEAGCNDYASKPIDKAALLETCGRWIRGTRGAQTQPRAA